MKKLQVANKAVTILDKKLNQEMSKLGNSMNSQTSQSLIQSKIDQLSSKKKVIANRIKQLEALNGGTLSKEEVTVPA